MRELLLAALLLQQAPNPAGVISGTVLYSDGTPAGALILRLVLLVPDQGQQARPGRFAVTDASGVFNLRVPTGRYVLQTGASNPTYYPGVLSQSSATPIIVTAGSTTSGLDFSLPLSASGVRVHGHVALPQGYPVAASGIRIALSRDNPAKPLAADGTFEFTHVMPGTYPLSVTAPGAQPLALTVSDRDITGIEMTVPPLTPIQGSVSVEGAGARPRFSLLMEGFFPEGMTPATSPNGPYRTSVTPAANGSFSTSLPPGEYRVTVANLPAVNYIKSIAANSKEILGRSFRIGPTVPPVRLAVAVGESSGVRVAGTVKRSDADSAVQPDKIALNSAGGGEPVETSIAPNGSFEFPSLLPGSYFVRVMLTPTVSSQPSLIVIPNRNTTDLEIPAPGTRELSGKVAVDGNGPPPRFTLFLTRDAKSVVDTGKQGELPSIAVSAIFNSVVSGGSAGAPVLQLDINALPDGSFSVSIPDGEYRVVAVPVGVPQISGIPAAYFVRSLTSNSGDLMTEALRVSENETPTISIGFGTTAPNPWVRVSGRVKGWDSSRGGLKVALESSQTSTIETFIDSGGKFEFPAVLQHNLYIARLIPPDDAASAPRITVEEKDVTGVEIVAPAKREVTARVVVEGNNPVPNVGLSLDNEDSSMTVVIRPEPDGTARIKLPENERRVRLTGLPLGYDVRSLTYGSVDLLKGSLKLAEAAPSELRIALALDPAFPSGSLRGRIRGLDPEKGSVQLILNGATAFARFEAAVNSDGSFNFPKLPQGTYIPSLEGGVTTTTLSPSSITVTATELVGIEFGLHAAGPKPPSTENPAKGATLADFGLSGRARANESAAVANIRTINTALITYLSISGGRYGSIEDMIKAGLLDESFRGVKAGFNYSVIAAGSDYAATAIPANTATGRYGFYALPDAVIRYSTFELLAPPQQSSHPVR
jgi:hypothetical protein